MEVEPEIIYGTPYDTPKIIEARERSISIHETINIKTPERDILRDALANKFYGEGASIKEKRLDLIIGRPASGKSTLAKKLAEEYDSLVIDSDEVKKLLPEYENGIGSGATHEESSLIADEMILEKALNNNDNVVFPRLGRNVRIMEELIDLLAKRGYKIHFHYVDLSIDKAIKRAIERFDDPNDGRFVDPDFILNEVGDKPEMVYNKIKNRKEVIFYEKLSSDVPKGQYFETIEKGPYDDATGTKQLHR